MIGQRLRELRTEHKLTRTELGRELDLSPQSIANYERNERFPVPEILIKFVKYFNCSLDYLFGISNIRNHREFDEYIALAFALDIDILRKINRLNNRDMSLLVTLINKMSEF